MTTVLKHFKGSGITYLNGIDAGTVDDVKITGSEETANLRNPRTGVGNIASLSRLSGLQMSMTFFTFNADNLAKGLRATLTTVAATPVVDEVLAVPASFTQDTLIPTAKIIDTSVVPVVTGTGGTPARTLNTDYTVTASGIIAIAGGAMAANDEIGYTPKAGSVLEAFVNSAAEYSVLVDGINNVENDEPHRVQGYKWKPSPVSDLPLISGGDFSSFTLTGELVADTTKPAGVSQYFKADLVT